MNIKKGQIYKHHREGILLITSNNDQYFNYRVIKKNEPVEGYTSAAISSNFSNELELIDIKIANILYGKL